MQTDSSQAKSTTSVRVTGDFQIDRHFYQQAARRGGNRDAEIAEWRELGGAARIHRLLDAFAMANGPSWASELAIDETTALEACGGNSTAGDEGAEPLQTVYRIWRPGKSAGVDSRRFWREEEELGRCGGDAWPLAASRQRPTSPEVLVIADADGGFRSRVNSAHWGLSHSGESSPRWIVIEASRSLAEGDLWREFVHRHAPQLVLVVTAEGLRERQARLCKELSWEQTLEDVLNVLRCPGPLQSLFDCRHVVIAFGSEGALWIHREQGRCRGSLVFDPEHVEGELQRASTEGRDGRLACLTAAVTAELARASTSPEPTTIDLAGAARRGLTGMRALRAQGHGDASRPGRGFPATMLAEAMSKADAAPSFRTVRLSFDEFDTPVRPGWSLLALQALPGAVDPRTLFGVARQVLRDGPRRLQAPTLRVGDYLTADRGEIEALRGLRQLVQTHVNSPKADKPLSIGVFGPPGAGKSFAVRELARELLGERLGWLEFNLSQFNGPEDLIGALHQVRDRILEGRTPVAFFDEFDSQNLAWLKYLLAPMQDGRFQEGQISHPVGKCLFMFAGGTSSSFEEFLTRGSTDSPHSAHFVGAKGPDFASRLDGRLNVRGPNRHPSSPREQPDIFFPVRRALFVRSRLRCAPHERLHMQVGLAAALIELPHYKHGSRSMTKLLEPLRMQRQSHSDAPLDVNSLPPRDQLAMQVDVDAWEALCRRDEEAANRLGVDKLAHAVHEYYRRKAAEEGWLSTELDRDFSELSTFHQASNRAAARRIPGVLALAGLMLVEGAASEQERLLIDAEIAAHVDLLGEAEHEGWMEWHLANGWISAQTRDDDRQLHSELIPFGELTEAERAKDRESVRRYPEIVALAGFKIVPLE